MLLNKVQKGRPTDSLSVTQIVNGRTFNPNNVDSMDDYISINIAHDISMNTE